jgi:hypothetical protein
VKVWHLEKRPTHEDPRGDVVLWHRTNVTGVGSIYNNAELTFRDVLRDDVDPEPRAQALREDSSVGHETNKGADRKPRFRRPVKF